MTDELDITTSAAALGGSRTTRRRYDRNAPIYDFFTAGMERARYRRWRELLWSKALGRRVLEIGVGTGRNLSYHPRRADVTAVDLSGGMLAGAARIRSESPAARLGLAQMDAQYLALAPAVFDVAVATFVFCSVPDPVRGLEEVRRTLAPGGRLLLLEHVRSPHPLVACLMDWTNPIMVRMTGVNINRDTVANVCRAGFRIESVTTLGGGGIYILIEASSRLGGHVIAA